MQLPASNPVPGTTPSSKETPAYGRFPGSARKSPTHHSAHHQRDESATPRHLLAAGVAALALLASAALPARADAATASCFGPGLFGNRMANGPVLYPGTVAIAHRTLPFGTRLVVSHGGRRAVATVHDRGPFTRDRHGRYDRTFDLSQALVQRFGYGSCRAWGVKVVRTWRAR